MLRFRGSDLFGIFAICCVGVGLSYAHRAHCVSSCFIDKRTNWFGTLSFSLLLESAMSREAGRGALHEIAPVSYERYSANEVPGTVRLRAGLLVGELRCCGIGELIFEL